MNRRGTVDFSQLPRFALFDHDEVKQNRSTKNEQKNLARFKVILLLSEISICLAPSPAALPTTTTTAAAAAAAYGSDLFSILDAAVRLK